ncbi:unnamed protein product [Prorocentrum cordatum]|uniref:Inorganic phosphate cotransporter n=1 Tax=Prorocentrum cordatum TaxID=2364126 RepID=A0ABN9UID4_9DINO|nr:unnamed protein product [Polarella glacialis]
MFVERFEGTTAAIRGRTGANTSPLGGAKVDVCADSSSPSHGWRVPHVARGGWHRLQVRLRLPDGPPAPAGGPRVVAQGQTGVVEPGLCWPGRGHADGRAPDTPSACVFALTLAAASQGVHSCGFKANYLDLTSAHSGALAGIGNTFASIASAAGPVITSAALARAPGDWESLFGGLFMLNVSGAAVVLLWLCVENLDTRRKPSEDGKDATSVVWSFSSLFGFSLSRSSP